MHVLYFHSDTGCEECEECEAGSASNKNRTECDMCGVGKYIYGMADGSVIHVCLDAQFSSCVVYLQ